MPRIKITGRLPKAALGFETTNTTTMPPQFNGPISFKRPSMEQEDVEFAQMKNNMVDETLPNQQNNKQTGAGNFWLNFSDAVANMDKNQSVSTPPPQYTGPTYFNGAGNSYKKVDNAGAPESAWQPLSGGGNQLSGFTQQPMPSLWDANLDISGQNPNDAYLPQKTIVTGDGNKTVTPGVNTGAPKLYSTDPNSTSEPEVVTPKLKWGQKFANWTDRAFNNTNKALQTPAKVANSIQMGLGVTNAITSYIDNERIAKEMKRKQLQSRFNAPVSMPVGTVGSRGDYTQEGVYDPKRYVVNKGMYSNELAPGLSLGKYGGELDEMALGGGIIEEAAPDIPLDVISLDAMSKQPSSNPNSQSNLSNVDASSSDSEYMLPLQKFTITSGFGPRKPPKGPNGFASSQHNGLDLGVGINTDVFSPMNGVVKSIYSNGAGGNQLIIEHEDGSRTGYAHLNGYKVKVGDNVSKGQVIALSGNTGNSNGPHLHFTYRNPSGDLVDPTRIFNFNIGSPKQKKSTGSLDPTITNNPLNIHYGDFTKNYGATVGGEDNGGYVAAFPTPEVGVKAAKDLLMGAGYAGAGLTISQARNKWVSGNPNITNPSTPDVVKSMGGDKKLIELTPKEINNLLVQFAKWENSKSPDIIKRYSFEEGGEINTPNTYNEGEEYELSEDEIREILNNGGNVKFI
jgi:murein DD-endopeptidase MepM/ murein hydrolase activator NlpD